ncbi:2-hydroxyacid dehydrogenase [Antarcticirhabdus aurantiaca]|uniref:Glyoxylate/hydroxypyruvate reductase A n=1 Tax=Antarcticirhabdus aurantiaca TaxID=2606717 RepID=A0ACD4NTK7_9HYPH|nr:glyoxylate/hydroxypyruvate reductase A [Antarcticirhabdus aurantiaca]WAJ30137.1 glyoxylate/hydroxypyruvate reductase A [Jeongeuplla avenae]
MSVLLAVTGFDPAEWAAALEAAAPGRTIRVLPDGAGDPEIRYAVVWKPPAGALSALPNLRAVFSLGAGVDHLLAMPDLPDVPVARIVAGDLTARMTEYAVWRVLDHARRGRFYREAQNKSVWIERGQPAASELTVGILGFGELGRDAGEKLAALGFRVLGWSRTAKHHASIEVLPGEDGLSAVLGRSDILLVLLPLTADTRGILDARLFARLKHRTPLGEGPVLINAGRGGLQNEADILEALDSGRLSEASLDVFETEPLPAASPLWRHPRVFVTPHIAAASSAPALAPIIMRQIEAAERGEALQNLVDRKRGY